MKLPAFRRRSLAGPIGLDLGQERLNLMQLERAGESHRIRAYASLAYPESREKLTADPKGFAAFVRKGMAGKPFSGRKVVSCLPSCAAMVFNIRYGCCAPEEEGPAIVRAVMNYIDDEAPEDLVIDYLPIRSGSKDSGDRTALAMVARRREVLAYLELLGGTGLEVLALDVGPAALNRLVVAADGAGGHPSALLINMGRRRTYMTVRSGRRLILDRELNFGESNLASRLGGALEMEKGEALQLLYRYGFLRREERTEAEELAAEIVRSITEILKPVFLEVAEEVNKVLLYTASENRGRSIEGINLFGCLARYPGCVPFMSDILSIPVAVIDPFECFGKGGGKADPTSISLATGLALRGLEAHG